MARDHGKLSMAASATAARCWTLGPAISAAASLGDEEVENIDAARYGLANPATSGAGAGPSTAQVFRTRAYGREEYTNSITASRDTNLSPREAYDVLRQRVPAAAAFLGGAGRQPPRALDVGAGAGLSTAVLYGELGYQRIDAVDWSGDAWDENVIEPVPDGVLFYAMDDDQYFREHPDCRYNVIVYNFAVNADKATRVARRYLSDDGKGAGGLLLAPVNDRDDYWYKQSYLLVNGRGDVVWRSPPEVGAWSVQFQPDVTSPTCTGIWCGGMNGYQSKGQQPLRK